MVKGPLVHCITNAVTAPFVADCVAAVGGRPIMAEDPADCADLAKVADGLCINLGQLNEHKREAILASLKNRGDRPWVLDPVGVGALPSRLEFAQRLLEFKPRIIRGNASEVYALATGQPSGSGIDSSRVGLTRRQWFELAAALPAQEVAVTDIKLSKISRDAVYDPDGVRQFEGGSPIMGKFPGFGCALSAVCAAWGQASMPFKLFSNVGQQLSTSTYGGFRADFLSEIARQSRAQKVRDMLRLYFVAGPQDHPKLDELLAQAIESGITCFQHRDKTQSLSEKKRYKHTLKVAQLSSVPWMQNDDLGKALSFGSDGLHLGQSDGDPKQAREQLGPDAIIGLSVSKPEHWAKYDPRYVDYVGIGPFAATQTKPDARQPLGAEGIRQLRQGYEHVPSVAIGGIDEMNAREALSSGVDGIAVVSAIAKADDPAAATRNLAALVQSHFQTKGWIDD